MNRTIAMTLVSASSVGLAAAMASCSGTNVATPASAPDSGQDVAQAIDAGQDAPSADAASDAALADAPADARPAAGWLTLSLDPTLDIAGDTVKATAISFADLLDKTGAKIATAASITGSSAFLSLAGTDAGADYFIEINGDADDLVPTRVDDPSKALAQRVGTTLRSTYVGPESAPVYRANTYSVGQGRGPMVRYADGAPIAGQQAYVLMTLGSAAPKVELKVLGTGALVALYATFPPTHGSAYEPFDDWLINTTGRDHHGDMYNADGGAAA